MKHTLAAGLLVVCALAVAFALGQRWINEPLSLPADGYLLEVPPGSSLRAVSKGLAADGVLDFPDLLIAYGRLSGQASIIKAGEYQVSAGTTPRALLRQLVEGSVKLYSLTIVEGWTLRELMRAIRKSSAIKHTLTNIDGSKLGRELELATPEAEGWFFPDTYRFPRGTTDREILTMAASRMQIVLAQAWAGRKPDIPLEDPYDALILASIVERETALDRERPLVAGVFSRRLKAGMKLQTDPTVIYGLGEDFDGNLRRRDLLRDTPYNTYTRPGLPPTPIALPGESSLLAAVQPAGSDELYFVASGADDGSHVFSATLREHNAAVKRYLEVTRASDK